LAIGLLFSCTDGKRKRVLFRHSANIAVTHDYSEGLALIMTDDGKYGYIDQKRQMTIPPEYDCAYDFHEGLAVVG
ncbi:MAG: WG repeat-containing protein, partial [Prevotella sp.]|nr:WG repeat-containing protein [Prevotella sp.]